MLEATMTDDLQEFGRRVYKLLRLRNWTTSEMAERAGLTAKQISAFVTGQHRPTFAELMLLADACAVDPDDLMPGGAVVANDNDCDE
jgi:transcriptional regulator with XRE-family HTH domain